MKVLVIGATGHIGTYLVPRLLDRGCEVVAMSRGNREPYFRAPEWDRVEMIGVDRDSEQEAGTFGRRVAEVGADVVIDLILFDPKNFPQLLEALSGRVAHYLYCGTMWVYGPTEKAPTTESDPRRPDGDYGRAKAEIERQVLEASLSGRLPATVVHPGHIVGRGWPPIGPTGNLDLGIFEKLARGEEVCLPDHGLATLHHVHADDVAQVFELAVAGPGESVSSVFNVVTPQAVTLRAFCRAVAGWFGREANLSFKPWPEWKRTVSEQHAEETWEHIRHSPVGSIEKARRVLGFMPRYSTFQAVRESLAWLARNGEVDLPQLD